MSVNFSVSDTANCRFAVQSLLSMGAALRFRAQSSCRAGGNGAFGKVMDSRLTVVVVEEDRDRAIGIVDALKSNGDCEVFVINTSRGLASKIAAHAPDIVLTDIDNPTRDMMEELTYASGPLERPVAMFVSGADGGLAQAAIDAGLSAYVVDGLSPERVKPVVDTAIARFSMVRQMRNELAETGRAWTSQSRCPNRVNASWSRPSPGFPTIFSSMKLPAVPSFL